jgi:hypothetical protein
MEDVGDSDVTICDRIFTMCLMEYKSLDYDMYVWTALILIQFYAWLFLYPQSLEKQLSALLVLQALDSICST